MTTPSIPPAPPKTTTLTVVCAWCGASLGTKDGLGVEGISHGCCPDCLAKLFAADEGEDDG